MQMTRITVRHVAVLGSLGILNGALLAGCGSNFAGQAGDGESGGASSDSGGAAGMGAMGGAGADSDGSGGASGASPSSGGSGSQPGADAAVPPSCTPEGDADVPDDEFRDTDCDGIDGNAATAVFVSADGFDDGDGSLARPVRGLGRAIELATSSDRAVYVCNGTYRENLVITSGVAIYGGYDCQRQAKRVKDWGVVAPDAGVPLVIQGVGVPVHIERMAFRAAAGASAGESSQAGGVVDSTDVVFSHVEFSAAAGAHGKPGAPGYSPEGTPPVGADGADTQASICYGDTTVACDRYAPGGFSASASRSCSLNGSAWATRGGKGGTGGNIWLAQSRPTCLAPSVPDDAGAAGSSGEYHTGDGIWRPVAAANLGKHGADGVDGAGARVGVGRIEAGIYVASNSGHDGTDGEHGFPGKGGAGGTAYNANEEFCEARYYTGSGGGQGGAGGCAGGRALAGGAGGGSIALIVANSNVTARFSRFVTADGGAGGDGALGGTGTAGGTPGKGGAAVSIGRGQDGQIGGEGGDGGAGGPGGGGPSIAVLYQGTQPVLTDPVYSLGLPGAGGLAVSGRNAANGITGELVDLASTGGYRSEE